MEPMSEEDRCAEVERLRGLASEGLLSMAKQDFLFATIDALQGKLSAEGRTRSMTKDERLEWWIQNNPCVSASESAKAVPKDDRKKIVAYLRRRFRETWEAGNMVTVSELEMFLTEIERGKHEER